VLAFDLQSYLHAKLNKPWVHHPLNLPQQQSFLFFLRDCLVLENRLSLRICLSLNRVPIVLAFDLQSYLHIEGDPPQPDVTALYPTEELILLRLRRAVHRIQRVGSPHRHIWRAV
jgi:hypothetical protein